MRGIFLRPPSIWLLFSFLIILFSACSSGVEPTTEQTLPAWAAPAEIHQPASTIQSPEVTAIGDLGWKSIQGMVQSTRTDSRNVSHTEVILRHHSIVHPPGIELTTRSDVNGFYTFPEIFIHDSDVLILRVEMDEHPPVELRLTGMEAYYRSSFDIDLNALESPD